MKTIALLMVMLFLFIVGCGNESDQKRPAENAKQPSIVEQKKVDVVPPGMYRVGKDILANEYIIVGQGMIYMQAAKDSTGAFESIIFNDNFENRTWVTLKNGQYFTFKGNAEMYPAGNIEAHKVKLMKEKYYPPGMYKAGVDIPPGEYRLLPRKDMPGYVSVSNSSSHNLDDIVMNDNFRSARYITVKNQQFIKIAFAIAEPIAK